ncbi:unnamed protein product [Choristocarpus tenellus]
MAVVGKVHAPTTRDDGSIPCITSVGEVLLSFGGDDSVKYAGDEVRGKGIEFEEEHFVQHSISKAHVLSKSYKKKLEELRRQLARARAATSTATWTGREAANEHLENFDRLHEMSVEIQQDIGGNVFVEEAEGDEGLGSGEVAKRPKISAAEARTLATRYHSLVRQQACLLSAMKVLDCSEAAKAALEEGKPNLNTGLDKALQSTKMLRSLRDELAGESSSDLTSEHTGAANASLIAVADGRLSWLVKRLRVKLSERLTTVWGRVDPLAGGGDAAGAASQEEGLADVKVL